MTDVTGQRRPEQTASAAQASEALPHFAIVGAMKAGTTSLYEMLGRHPSVAMSRPKEPMYFSRDENFAQGEHWYRSVWSHGEPGQLCGEASTCYSRWPHFGDVVGRLHDAAPHAKLIYIMRHPVERAYSHYCHDMRHEVTMTFDEALKQDRSIVDASLYIRQIEQFLRRFPREQMLLLLLDDLQADAAAVMRRVQQFLGLAEHDLSDADVHANARGEVTAHRRVLNAVRRVRRWPGVEQAIDAIPEPRRHALRQALVDGATQSWLGRTIARRHQRRLSPLDQRTRRELLETFEPATRELERFLGRELPHWHM